jgi:hypothetical protein
VEVVEMEKMMEAADEVENEVLVDESSVPLESLEETGDLEVTLTSESVPTDREMN